MAVSWVVGFIRAKKRGLEGGREGVEERSAAAGGRVLRPGFVTIWPGQQCGTRDGRARPARRRAKGTGLDRRTYGPGHMRMHVVECRGAIRAQDCSSSLGVERVPGRTPIAPGHQGTPPVLPWTGGGGVEARVALLDRASFSKNF